MWRRKMRRDAACIASRRELYPTCRNSFFAADPWKRSMRSRAASFGSLTEIRPPSPRAKRFFVGKKLNVEAMLVAIPAAPKACAASSITGTPNPARLGAGRPKRCTGIRAFVRSVSLRSTSDGSRFSVTGSMSTKTGVAPTRAIASAVAKNVNAGQTTSSPAPMPRASSTRTSASVPFAQLTVSRTPSFSAASRSNESTSGPKMKRPLSSVRVKASCSSGISGAYCALTSTWAIFMGGKRSRAPASPDQVRRDGEDSRHDRVFHPLEVAVERVPARAEPPADAGQRGAPDAVADEREHVVASERALEEARRDGDERASDGSHAADEHRPALPPLEPALGTVDPLGRQVHPSTVALDERATASVSDPPPSDRADLVPGDAGDDDREVRRRTGGSPTEDAQVMRQRSRRERAAVHHHELARRRKDRVDEHQEEDRDDAVVREPGRHRGDSTAWASYTCGMCRNIRILYNFAPPTTDDEVNAAALQYVRKVSGMTKPSRANEAAFEQAVADVAAATTRLLDSLVTTAPPRDREVEAEKRRARSAARFA